MGRYTHTLKTLRGIALDYGAAEQPDLASMARELGRVVLQSPRAPATGLARRKRSQGFERWLLAKRAKPAISVLVMAWPPNHITPIHDHAGLWGLEMPLAGALEVQSYVRDADSGDLRALDLNWLGPGDSAWFEGDPNHVHRCRNLSRHETALTLHVYGGDLSSYCAYEQDAPSGRWTALAQHGAVAGRLLA
jgi:predicted metal-dependent enzyme (double-stranded beta helix superfamily)